MAINFPTGATLNQLYSYNGLTWIYTGTFWKSYPQLVDVFPITGGTFNNTTDTLNLTNSGGVNVSVTGITDVFITGGTYTAGTATFRNTTGGTFNVTGFTTGGTSGVEVFVSGGTYSSGTTTFTNTTGGTFSVTGFTNNYWQYRQAYQGFHATAGLSGSAYALALVANQLTAFPIDVKITTTISELVVGNVGASAGNSVWGLYTSSSGLPNTLIFQTTEFNNATTGAIVFTISPTQTLLPGIYWVVYHSSSTPTYRVMQVANSFPNVIGENGANFNGSGTYLFRSVAYSSTLPNPFGATSLPVSPSSLMPFIQFKLV